MYWLTKRIKQIEEANGRGMERSCLRDMTEIQEADEELRRLSAVNMVL
ncbi:hypothetical protein M3202_21990 [Alkalihalobacillus oceani]|uniref:Uncharacterized protein n=1 Tax=Halalkalibacter oceani TaxID=1653776 RepID=A0A9X2IRA5_9BACI|nr:hypothetical protein [Halalkalibacter oceani]MCM3716706.1 hypothetical protein [Halalkalibacter oceani]